MEQSNNLGVISLFADGACRGNPGPGAYGILALDEKGEMLFEDAGVDLSPTTNNKMELSGAIAVLKKIKVVLGEKAFSERSFILSTDSQYVTKGLTEWIKGWKKRGWRKADGAPVLNKDLWEELDQLVQSCHVKIVWVKGHAGHPQNEYCDQLANAALDRNGV